MSRFGSSLAAALVLHAAAALLARHDPAPPAPKVVAANVPELDVELQPAPAPDTGEATEPQAATAAAPVRAADASEPTATAATAALHSAPEADLDVPVPAREPAAVSSAGPARKIDLGLDHNLLLMPGAVAAPAVPDRSSELQRRLDASLSVGDAQPGLTRGRVLIGSLDAAARSAGPERGRALIRVSIDGDGKPGSVELIAGSLAEWAGTLQSFRRLATKKRVRLAPGAKGLRVTYSVETRVQRASGSQTDAPSVGVKQPSLAPNGLVPGGTFDVSDSSGSVQRVVYARVVSEELL